jgi:hypothetical protein
MRRHGNKVDVACGLRMRKIAACVHAGATNMPRRLIEDRIVSEIIEGREGEPRGQLRAEKARLKAIRAEDGEILIRIADREKRIGPAENVHDEGVAARQAIENEDLPAYSNKGQTIGTLVFMAADGSFMFWAFCDVAGIDLTQGVGDLAVTTAVMIILVSLLGVLVNSVCGFLATSPRPRLRLVGWLSLLTIAVTLGIMRAKSTAETNYAFTVFGCIVTMVAGYAAGAIQRRLLPIIGAHRAHRRRLEIAQKAESEAQAKLDEAHAAAEQLEERRRCLKAEAESLASMPARRATRKSEIEKIQDARLKSVRYYYDLGRRLFGRKPADEGEEASRD